MALLLPNKASLLVQGLTGNEGRSALPAMLKYGTNIVAGVTPGKGGQEVDGIPIFNSIKEAIAVVGPVLGSIQFVPPLFTKAAVLEAIEADLKFILIGAEKVPIQDIANVLNIARHSGIGVVGPSSVGVINPWRGLKLGLIGGLNPSRIYTKGEVAVISKSGGMTSEISLHLKQNGLGVSWAVGIGGERIIGSDFADWLSELEVDPQTKITVIFGEPGGVHEDKVATLVREAKIRKPVVAFIAGEFASQLPSEVQFGHAGALIEGDRGQPSYKKKILAESGVIVVSNFDDIASAVQQALKN